MPWEGSLLAVFQEQLDVCSMAERNERGGGGGRAPEEGVRRGMGPGHKEPQPITEK